MKTVWNAFIGLIAILVLGLTTLSFAGNRSTAEDREPVRARGCDARYVGTEEHVTRTEGRVTPSAETEEGEGRGERDSDHNHSE